MALVVDIFLNVVMEKEKNIKIIFENIFNTRG